MGSKFFSLLYYGKFHKSQKKDKKPNLIRLILDSKEINAGILREYNRIIIKLFNDNLKLVEKIDRAFSNLESQGLEYDLVLKGVNEITYLDCRRFA